MKIVVVGCGKFGTVMTELLIEEGHEVVVIDSNQQTIDKVSNTLDVMAILGNGADYDVLDEVGLAKADVCISCTASDEINMLVSCFARQMGCKYTIARLRSMVPGTKAFAFIKDELRLDLIASPEYITAADTFKLLHSKQVKNVMILGATRIAIYLTQMLLKANVKVTIIDRDENRCKFFCNNVSSQAIVINTAETDQKALINSGLKEADAVATLTAMDEENILTSLFAMDCKVPTIITKIEKANYTDIVHDLNLENVVSPRTSTSLMILDYVRGLGK